MALTCLCVALFVILQSPCRIFHVLSFKKIRPGGEQIRAAPHDLAGRLIVNAAVHFDVSGKIRLSSEIFGKTAAMNS
jgi:hypothetical protein